MLGFGRLKPFMSGFYGFMSTSLSLLFHLSFSLLHARSCEIVMIKNPNISALPYKYQHCYDFWRRGSTHFGLMRWELLVIVALSILVLIWKCSEFHGEMGGCAFACDFRVI